MTSRFSRRSCSRRVEGPGLGEAEADVVAQRADVGDVVVEPLQLEQHGAQACRRPR